MFDSFVKPVGREYTKTIAWLVVAIVFIPAIFVTVGVGYPSLIGAVAGSLICITLAWVTWKRSSAPAVVSLEPTVEK